MCVLTSILVLGIILMVVASQFFKQDKYNLLERSVAQATAVTSNAYIIGPTMRFNLSSLDLVYSSLSISIDGEFWLVWPDGSIILYTENNVPRAYTEQELMSNPIDPAIVSSVLEHGTYQDIGTLGGLYLRDQYIVGMPITTDWTEAVLFVASPTDTMHDFLIGVLKMFLLSAVVVLIIAFVLIYFITSGMVKPLKEMLAATHSFSKGDFSVRVPVAGYDELGKLSMAFNNMASTLAITESSRRSFVANVSHELKTPMTTISGFVDGILDGTIAPEKQTHYLMVVSSEVKRLSRLVRSMLDTARIEAGELQVMPVWFDISELNRQTIFTFEQSILEKKLVIEGLETDKIMVYADRDLMNQVLYNLIENAVKFVNESGTISFHYRNDAKMTYIAIRNTGEGLENEEIPRLFDRFYKLDKSRSLNKGGVGLGLHIVRSIINYHQGEVVVCSAPGEYTQFEIAIPIPASKKHSDFLQQGDRN